MNNMDNKFSRRTLFTIIASAAAITLVVPETKLFTIDHPAFAYIHECAEKNIRVNWDKYCEIKGVDFLLSPQLPNKFAVNYRNYIYENWGENFKETKTPRERYHHLLNIVQNQWKPEGYQQDSNSILIG